MLAQNSVLAIVFSLIIHTNFFIADLVWASMNLFGNILIRFNHSMKIDMLYYFQLSLHAAWLMVQFTV